MMLKINDVETFIDSAPEGSGRVLALMSVPESLTDKIAHDLYELAPLKNISSEFFLVSLKYTNLTIGDNHEWNISPKIRKKLYQDAVQEVELFQKANEYLLDVAKKSENQLGEFILPSYLYTQVAIAYHQVALNIDNSLEKYIFAFREGSDGERWLAAQLADLQQNSGLISPDAIEPAFMRGMSLYRDHCYTQALEMLGQVAEIDASRWEVAVSKHLVGKLLYEKSPQKAEILFRDSLTISKDIGDKENTLHVLNSYASLVRNHDKQLSIQLSEEGLNLATSMRDEENIAIFSGTLGNSLFKENPIRAEHLLEESIKISRRIKDMKGAASALHSLARLLKKKRPILARQLVAESIDIGRRLGDKRHLAQTLRTLGLIDQHENLDLAVGSLEESAAINHDIGYKKGEILSLNSLAQAYIDYDRFSEASDIYRRLSIISSSPKESFPDNSLNDHEDHNEPNNYEDGEIEEP